MNYILCIDTIHTAFYLNTRVVLKVLIEALKNVTYSNYDYGSFSSKHFQINQNVTFKNILKMLGRLSSNILLTLNIIRIANERIFSCVE